MIERRITEKVKKALTAFPVVGIIGPRQVGKTTLAKVLEDTLDKPTLFLDLERNSDRQRLAEPELFLTQQTDKCVIIDEIQNMPELLPLLRWLVDQQREPARFILTGSSTPDLIRNNTETLAGRIAYFELTPFTLPEIAGVSTMYEHWFRGGFPLSLLAESDEVSRMWLENFIDTFLQRDIRSLGYEISIPSMGRLLQVLASINGKTLNLTDVSNTMNINSKTLGKYLDILEGSFLIRRLPPYFHNASKRLVRAPKLYFRDTGLLHSLLQINSAERLHSTIFLGPSWEGYVIEQVISAAGASWQYDYYRTHAGAEADLVLWQPGGKKVLIEIKYSVDPTPARGFYESAAELKADHQYILIPEGENWMRNETQKVCGLEHFLKEELPSL
ncbi:MAG: ATP-binding protein [Saprospiraceae bacterium]|nr:ATP-binding protein [Saprospiraceae bacterium]